MYSPGLILGSCFEKEQMTMSTRLMQEIFFFLKEDIHMSFVSHKEIKIWYILVDRKFAGNRKHRCYSTVSQIWKKQKLKSEENSRKKSWDTFQTTGCPTLKEKCNFTRHIDMKQHFFPYKSKKELWGYLRANSHTLKNADMY